MSFVGDQDENPSEIASTVPRIERAMSSEDVTNLYRLLLGRSPEDAVVVERNRTRPFDQLLTELLASREFAARIEHDLNEQRADVLPNAKPFMEWIERCFGLPRAQANTVETYQAALAAVLSSPGIWEQFRYTFGRRALEIVVRLNQLSHSKGGWEGYFDECNDNWIRGWVRRVKPAAPARIAIYADGLLLALAEANEYRDDVANTIGSNGICGFRIQPRFTEEMRARQKLHITVRDTQTNETLPLSGKIVLGKSPSVSELSEIGNEVRQLAQAVEALSARLQNLSSVAPIPSEKYDTFRTLYEIPGAPELLNSDPRPPMISIIVPVAPSNLDHVRRTISSVRAQTCEGWETLLVCQRTLDPETDELVRQATKEDARFRTVIGEAPLRQSEALNLGVLQAGGAYILPLSPGDEIDRKAIQWFGRAAAISGGCLIYADEATQIETAGYKSFTDSHFKPAFDYYLLLQSDFISGACCISRDCLTTMHGFRPEFDGYHIYDAVLRLASHFDRQGIVHIPLVLHHRCASANPQGRKDATPSEDGRTRVVAAHLAQSGDPARLIARDSPGLMGRSAPRVSINWAAPADKTRISIIIPTRDRHDILRPCIESLLRCASSPNRLEILIVNNQSSDPATIDYLKHVQESERVRVVEYAETFNWSRINNFAARATTGDILLFMNNDMEMWTHGYDNVLGSLLARRDVGAVGALLLYGDGSIQHAGIAVGVDGVASNISTARQVSAAGYAGQDLLTRNVSAVTGAFLGATREIFEMAGGFDEERLPIAFNDVDFCLKIRELGLDVIYAPDITCLHYESVSRGIDTIDPEKRARARLEVQALQDRWGEKLKLDLFYNPNFSRSGAPFQALQMPSRETVLAHVREQIRWQKLRARQLSGDRAGHSDHRL